MSRPFPHPWWLPFFVVLGALLAVVSLAEAPEPRVVINAGRGGDSTQDLLARVDNDVLAHTPDLVVLLAGTNDSLNSRKAIPIAQYEENLRRLADQLTSRGAKLLLVTIPPAHAPYLLTRHPKEFFGAVSPAMRIAAVNDVVHRVARARAMPVVEFHGALEKAGGAAESQDSLIRNVANSGVADGVHPTAAGYRLLAESVAAVIAREKLLGCRKVICFGDSITFGVHVRGEGTATGETYPGFLLRALNEAETR